MQEENQKPFFNESRSQVYEASSYPDLGDHNYLSILNHLPDTVLKVNKHMEILWANQTVLDVLPDAVGKYCYMVYHGRTTPCDNCPSCRCLDTGERETGVMAMPDMQNPQRLRYTENIGIPIKNEAGEVIEAIIVGKDVTAHREIINQLRMMTESQDSQKLQSHEDEKKRFQFIYHMTGEIKYQIDQIKDEIQFLKNHTTDAGAAGIDRLSQISEKTSRQLDNIFELFSIESKSINLIYAPFDLRELIDEIYNRFRTRLYEKSIVMEYHLDAKTPKRLIGDVFRLNNMFSNIIENAIMHTENGKVKIDISSAMKGENRVGMRVVISDTGMGFTEEQLTLLKEVLECEEEQVFQQAATLKGMSLITAKRLTAAMEGSLGITSRYGRGTEIVLTFALPFVMDQAEAFEKKVIAKPQAKRMFDALERKKILIAEDEVVGRVSIKLMLQNHYDIVLAKNGKEAVDAFKNDQPDLVLMDIMMPVMDGFEAFDQIEKINRNHIPIIACTARVIDSEKEYLMSYGFTDYLPKPVDLSSVNRILMKYLKQGPI